jgi:hypothetical protein
MVPGAGPDSLRGGSTMKITHEKISRFLPLIVGAIIFLLVFFIGIFGIDLEVGEALMLSAFLGVCAAAVSWWREQFG